MTPLTVTERSLLAVTKLPFIGRLVGKQLERHGFYDNDEIDEDHSLGASEMTNEPDVGLHPETAYLTHLLERAFDALDSAHGVALELERDHVLEEGMMDVGNVVFEIVILLERLEKFNASETLRKIDNAT